MNRIVINMSVIVRRSSVLSSLFVSETVMIFAELNES